MRIAYLTQSYPPMISGAAHSAQAIAEDMAQRGHEVLVIAASDKYQPYLTQNGHLSVLRLKSMHNPLRVGQRFLVFPYRRVTKALSDFQPEIIHIHEPLQMSMIGIRYSRRVHIPSVLTIHQLPAFVASYLPNVLRGFVERCLWIYARQLAQMFDAIITPTQTVSALVTRITGCQANTISYGLDLQTFHPVLPGRDEAATRRKWDLPPDVPILLHVGRLDPDKHVDRVIQAAARTMTENNAHLLIVGDGIQKPGLIKLSKSLGISSRVHFTGFISVKQGLPDIYRAARLFVTASEIETQGIVLLEAAACGLPIVAVNATCIPEIVHDGFNGFLTEPGNLIALGNAMSVLIKDQEQAGNMGKASLVLAQQHKICSTMDAHENLYRQVIQQEHLTDLPAGMWRKQWLKRVSTWMSMMK